MKKSDYVTQYSNEAKTLQLISSVTENAAADRKYEGHAHYDELEIYYFIEGELYFAFEGTRYPVREGTLVIIANGTLHRPIIKAPCKYCRKRILFSKEIFAPFGAAAVDLYSSIRKKKIMIFRGEEAKELKPDKYFRRIEAELSKSTRQGDFSALIALFSLLLSAEEAATDIDEGKNAEGTAAQIIKYIEDNLTADLSYKTISVRFFISEKSLYKFFKGETGFTLANYVTERRIIKAQSLLSSGRTAKEAAMLSGFSDYSVFYRSFLKKVGMPPTKYAKRNNNVF